MHDVASKQAYMHVQAFTHNIQILKKILKIWLRILRHEYDIGLIKGDQYRVNRIPYQKEVEVLVLESEEITRVYSTDSEHTARSAKAKTKDAFRSLAESKNSSHSLQDSHLIDKIKDIITVKLIFRFLVPKTIRLKALHCFWWLNWRFVIATQETIYSISIINFAKEKKLYNHLCTYILGDM